MDRNVCFHFLCFVYTGPLYTFRNDPSEHTFSPPALSLFALHVNAHCIPYAGHRIPVTISLSTVKSHIFKPSLHSASQPRPHLMAVVSVSSDLVSLFWMSLLLRCLRFHIRVQSCGRHRGPSDSFHSAPHPTPGCAHVVVNCRDDFIVCIG